MAHPAINQRGDNDRAEVCSWIFLTSIYPALTALLFYCKTLLQPSIVAQILSWEHNNSL